MLPSLPGGVPGGPRLRVVAICAALLLAVGLVFGRVASHEFVDYDDFDYVHGNPFLRAGLGADGLRLALSQRHAFYCPPLTWLSHLLDRRLFGLDAGGHHLSSVVIHAASAVLLFLVLLRLAGRMWPAAAAAALFAVHPLRVESVAWVAERKDVLSGLFFVLTIGAYARYVRRPASITRYSALIVAYALGLLSKSMLVTLPAVLLLLDWWPLGRMRPASLVPLVREKLPLLVLAAASGAMTLWAQQSAVMPGERLPFAWRAGNAVVAYATYVGKLLFPANLAVFYPHPGAALPTGKIAAAALSLLGATAAAVALRKRHPHLLVGWLWYLGMLVPVIGLLQVGGRALADRFTYLPQVGLAVAAAWAGAMACRTCLQRRRLAVAACASIALLAAMAWRQTGHWRDSESLFTHALAVTSGNHVAHNNLGLFLAGRGRTDEAIGHFRSALEIVPEYADARVNLGLALSDRGQVEEAVGEYRRALASRPDHARANNNLGSVLATRGELDEAIARFRNALETSPDYADARNNLGLALASQRRFDEAIAEYRKAIDVSPDHADAHNNLGAALASSGRTGEAITHFGRAVALNPEYLEARNNLGFALAAERRHDEAVEEYRRALELAERQGRPDLAEWLRAKVAALEGRKAMGTGHP